MKVLKTFHAPRPEGGNYIIPAGFIFDGGSIPRSLLVLVVLVNQMIGKDYWIGWCLVNMVLVGLMLERFELMLTALIYSRVTIADRVDGLRCESDHAACKSRN